MCVCVWLCVFWEVDFYNQKVKEKQKSNTSVYQGHINFRKKVSESSQSAGQNWTSKIRNFDQRSRKVNASKFFNIDIHIIQKSKTIKSE